MTSWSLSDEETRRGLVELTRLGARVAALQLKVAAHADRAQVGDATGATSAGVWWANETRMTQAEAHRKMRLAKALEGHEPVGEALAAGGGILVDQARDYAVVVAGVAKLLADQNIDVVETGASWSSKRLPRGPAATCRRCSPCPRRSPSGCGDPDACLGEAVAPSEIREKNPSAMVEAGAAEPKAHAGTLAAHRVALMAVA